MATDPSVRHLVVWTHFDDGVLSAARVLDLPPGVAEALPGLRPEDIDVCGAHFARKIEAVERHASQVPLLLREWPDLLERDGPLRRERYWTVTSLADVAPGVILQV